MITDEYGNPATANAEAAAAFDRAVDDLLHFRADVVESAAAVVAADPSFPLGHAFDAYLGILGTEPEDAANAAAALGRYLEGTDVTRLLPREQLHLAAAGALVDGDWYTGGALLRELTTAYPRDPLATAVGHQCDFFTGAAASLRDRVGSVLTAWSPQDRHYSQLLGMYAFGLEESGLYARAEDVGIEAVERDHRDVWGVHAVVHTFEMQGRFRDGLDYLDARAGDWQTGNFLNVHNWWHYCLYQLEAGNTTEPLRIYDAVLNSAQSAGVCLEMLDASALLWRLYLEGSDQSVRWVALADDWQVKMSVPHYAFNDMHAVMAYVGAGRFTDARALIESRRAWIATAGRDGNGSAPTNVAMTRDVGLPVCRALIAFGEERYRDTVAELLPIRTQVNRAGGSHAQRDAVQRTLLEAALRSDQHDVARVLLSERLGVNPCSPYAWLKQASLATALGDAAASAAAAARAEDLRG
jgi:hypothetical protein